MTAAPRARPGRRAILILAAALALGAGASSPGCHRDIHLLPLADEEGGGGAGVGGAAGAGLGGATAGAPGGVVCSGSGDPIMLPTGAGPVCAGTLEARGHRFALCTCDTLNLNWGLRTDAFDSTNSGVNDEVSAAVGVDGALQTTAELRAGGAIYVADANVGVQASDHLQAGASFESNGPLAMLSQNADLLADAYVGGAISGQVDVSGTLHVPTTADLGAGVLANAVVTGPVSIVAPCDCSDGFVDLAAAMTAAATTNNDAAAGLDPDAFSNVMVTQSLDLDCGTYYLSSIQAKAPITLTVHGRVLLAVAGAVGLQGGGLTVNLDASAELDLLVGGWLTANGGGTIGASAAPARFRIWIAGTDSVVFDGQPTVAAVIHAPASAVTAPAGVNVSGSLLVKSLTIGDDSLLHYDRAILAAGVPCGEPAEAVIP